MNVLDEQLNIELNPFNFNEQKTLKLVLAGANAPKVFKVSLVKALKSMAKFNWHLSNLGSVYKIKSFC